MDTSHDTTQLLRRRWNQLNARLAVENIDGLVITGGSDMEYLTGYKAMPLERITALVALAPDADNPEPPKPTLYVPELERARVADNPEIFDLEGWDDSVNPVELVAARLDKSRRVAVSNDMWSIHVLGLQALLTQKDPTSSITTISEAFGGLRSIKSVEERNLMVKVGSLADVVATQLQQGEIPLVGRSEAQVAEDIASRLLSAGHERVEFVIVASGPNSASPHHHPGDRIIQANEMVLCDFGGKYMGYCSDTTRCVFTGPIPDEIAEAYEALHRAQAAGVSAAQPGSPLAEVDHASRGVLTEAGYGDYFVHRTGHGIGVQVHEEPYVTGQTSVTIEPGHTFSVEPGIYIDGKWGMRLEDIVVVNADGPQRCNNSPHELISVEA